MHTQRLPGRQVKVDGHTISLPDISIRGTLEEVEAFLCAVGELASSMAESATCTRSQKKGHKKLSSQAWELYWQIQSYNQAKSKPLPLKRRG